MRLPGSSPRLQLDDAVAIWLMRLDGAFQHVIAAHLHVNQGRVSEILSGKRFPEAQVLARQRKGE